MYLSGLIHEKEIIRTFVSAPFAQVAHYTRINSSSHRTTTMRTVEF
jgi:hypothetical protein